MNEINTKCVTNCVEGYYLIKVHRYHFCFCVLKLFSVPFLLCICGSIIFILGLKFYFFFVWLLFLTHYHTLVIVDTTAAPAQYIVRQ